MTQKQIAIKYLQMIRDFDNDESQYDDPGEIAAAALEELAEPTVLDLIAQEREKQISKGYTVEHDAEYYPNGELGDIAQALLTSASKDRLSAIPYGLDGWDSTYWNNLCVYKPYDERVPIAGAFVLAELERLLFIQNKEQ